MGLLGVTLSAPRDARANTGKSILETMGISIAVGTVLGASTLPFYEQPGDHISNLALGAAAGAVAGTGILLYGLFRGASQDEASEAAGLIPSTSHRYRVTSRNLDLPVPQASPLFAAGLPQRSVGGAVTAKVWMPLVSLTW